MIYDPRFSSFFARSLPRGGGADVDASHFPRRIDCGLRSVNVAMYRRDYYVNANGQTVKIDSREMGRRGHHLHLNEHEQVEDFDSEDEEELRRLQDDEDEEEDDEVNVPKVRQPQKKFAVRKESNEVRQVRCC